MLLFFPKQFLSASATSIGLMIESEDNDGDRRRMYS